MQLSTREIRKKFISFFKKQFHSIQPSSSLVPVGDDSLFFTNAGMVQFKSLFLGKEKADVTRVSTVQRCLRASGKHNDLTNVGFTKRHHTFFEMLGNFSFGDYFKKEAIHFAWKFLTEELMLPADRLWITVHEQDLEAISLWKDEFRNSGYVAQGISTCGDKDNFWSMGNLGPCGYCSEIYYDHGDALVGSPPGGEIEGDRYVEIWNLVFMQFERKESGEVVAIPAPAIDTGMGLERIAAVMQGVNDNYDIDIFKKLRKDFCEILLALVSSSTFDTDDYYFAERVVSDHIRAVCFLIADGILPENEGAGYVLRSIIRRAVYYIYHLGVKEACFYRLVPSVVEIFQDIYPEVELVKKSKNIMQLIEEEEWRFLNTLERGVKILEHEILDKNVLSGELAFKLHDTYGVPFILTQEIVKQKGIMIDEEKFNSIMENRRELSRVNKHKDNWKNFSLGAFLETKFVGYQQLSIETLLEGIYTVNGQILDELKEGENGVIILSSTPFYGESGGQVGDRGSVISENGEFVVSDTQKINGRYLHFGTLVKGILKKKDKLMARVDKDRRLMIQANHSATHLLHRVLRDLLGDQATQRGSYVDDVRLRFDFVHNQALGKEMLEEIERIVNVQIRKNRQILIASSTLEEAKKEGVTALFNEKYGKVVRVVEIGENYSKELCGGTHVSYTGEIGYFKIIKEESTAAGIRRIEAVTGERAVDKALMDQRVLLEIQTLLKNSRIEQLSKLVNIILAKNLNQNSEILSLKEKILRLEIQKKLDSTSKVLVLKTDLSDLKRVWDLVKECNFSGVAIIYKLQEDKFRILVGVEKIGLKANNILKNCLQNLGKGGGKEDVAEGGGVNVKKFVDNVNKIKVQLEKII